MAQLERHSLSRSVPDDQLNWSQIGETLTLLALAVAQIDTSMKEGNDSVDTLTHSFTSIASKSRLLLDHFAKVDPNAPQEIKNAAEIIHAEVGKAVVAFQFYDRLSQRMEHVGETGILKKNGFSYRARLKRTTPWKPNVLCSSTSLRDVQSLKRSKSTTTILTNRWTTPSVLMTTSNYSDSA